MKLMMKLPGFSYPNVLIFTYKFPFCNLDESSREKLSFAKNLYKVEKPVEFTGTLITETATALNTKETIVYRCIFNDSKSNIFGNIK